MDTIGDIHRIVTQLLSALTFLIVHHAMHIAHAGMPSTDKITASSYVYDLY